MSMETAVTPVYRVVPCVTRQRSNKKCLFARVEVLFAREQKKRKTDHQQSHDTAGRGTTHILL